jgi:hypothetical protein
MRAAALPYMRRLPVAQTLPNAIRLVKLRADYFEFAVYQPIHPNGIEWARMYFANRLNVGNSGAGRMVRATSAKMYAATAATLVDENYTAGTQAQAPTVTKIHSDATARVGTWTAAATTGSVTGVRYSTATADYVEYTITGVDRIALRTYQNNGVAGIFDVLITESAVEIPDANYVLVAKKVNLRVDTGYASPPLAKGLNPALTYVVRLTVSATNPVSGRCYDAGLFGYITDSTAIGPLGSVGFQSIGSPAVSTTRCLYPGTLIRYSVPQCTRVQFRYMTNTTAGIIHWRVLASNGTELSTGSIDAYNASTIDTKVTLADGLTKADYILEVTLGNTKNASSSNYRFYVVGSVAVDTTLPGVPATGIFDDLGAIPSESSPDSQAFQATGNCEYAIMARRTTDANGVNEDFITGTHGHEGAPTSIVFQLDGVTIDYAGAAAGTVWNGARLTWTYTTTAKFVSGENLATLAHSNAIDRTGWWYDITRTMLANATVKNEYVLMVQSPKEGATDGSYGGGCRDAYFWPSTDHIEALLDNETSFLTSLPATKVALPTSSGFALCELLNLGEIVTAMAGIGTVSASLLQDRADGITKCYTRTATFGGTGTTLPSGNVITARRRMRFGLM